ncbi:hypothetical protein [Psychroserpens ponticola]|uniref:DUF3606 domain-containing protein n=1 Tax=Psychroserpens ponticola TaxID=2932268 RepID=A0ABY7S2I2_9FLAO|nr:hypothetical protein [Psychroserpens ponticola]WCO03487.1 hypothetical protein MUN68_008255 [Psychroserpens ponticola]
MKNPLTKQQERLRGKKVNDMTNQELETWIQACDKMENWVNANKARRSWTQSRDKAESELEKRTKN